MTRLRGEGLGSGMALGTAVIIQMREGLPILPDPPERVTRSLASHRGMERPEVILVAEDYRTALALAGALPWAKVAGIATVGADTGATPPFPVVLNLTGLLDIVQNDMLLLVDADRGVVFVDPNATALAQYTAEHSKISPKHRLYLDEEHQPALTTDGLRLQVAARIQRWEDIAVALQQGADALYLPMGNALLTKNAGEDTLRRELFRLIDEASGKPLIVSDNYSLSLPALLMAAAKADLTFAVPPQETMDGLGFAELQAEFREAESECYENDQVCAMPRIAADLGSVSGGEASHEDAQAFVESLAAHGATRLILSMTQETLTEGALVALSPLLTAAQSSLLPAFASASPFSFNAFGQNDLENSLATALRLLIGAGATGLIVPAEETEATKTLVRSENAEECRDLLRRALLEAEG